MYSQVSHFYLQSDVNFNDSQRKKLIKVNPSQSESWLLYLARALGSSSRDPKIMTPRFQSLE